MQRESLKVVCLAQLLLLVGASPLEGQEAEPAQAPLVEPATQPPVESPVVPDASASRSEEALLSEEAIRALDQGEREAARYLLERALARLQDETGTAPIGPPVVTAPAVALVVTAPVEVASEPIMQEAPVEAAPTHPWGNFSLDVGLVAGFAWIGSGLAADRARPPELDDRSPWQGCDARNEGCTVRVEQAGFGVGLALRVGAFIRPERWVRVGVAARVQPDSGEGTLAGWLFDIEGRFQPWQWDGVALELILALGLGQVQHRPVQEDVVGPYVRSGLGWGSAGLALFVDLDPHVAISFEVRPRVAFPDVLAVLDTSLGLRVGM